MLQTFTTQLKQKYPSIQAIRILDENVSAPTVEIILQQYNLHVVNALLIDIGTWAKDHESPIEPLFLSAEEATQLQALSDTYQDMTPEQIVASYRSHKDHPTNARLHILTALQELQRSLHKLQKGSPASGLESHHRGQTIAFLFAQLMGWGAVVFEQPYTNPDEIWSFCTKQFSVEPPGFSLESVLLPLRLRAFIKRHKTLTSLSSQTFVHNDFEIENLIQPLLSMTRSLQKEAIRRLTPQTEMQERHQKRIRTLGFSLATVLVLAAILWWALRPPVLYAIQLPTGSLPGGIIGKYYSDPYMNQFRNQRVDPGIQMHWRTSPLAQVPPDHFSVRWQGFLEAPQPGKYKICTRHDDGVKLRLGHKELIEDWLVGGPRTKCAFIHLTKGWHALDLQMFEDRGEATIELYWQPPQRPDLHIIPADRLCCKK